MSDVNDQNPAGNTPGATGGEQPTATNPQGQPAASGEKNVPEGYELIRTEDKNNLIAARDRANGRSQDSEEFLQELAKERAVNSFLEENKEDFPDISADDLMNVYATNVDELKAEATRMQQRYEQIKQNALKNVQTATPPSMSPADKAARLKALKENPNRSSFSEMVNLRTSS